MSLDVYLEVDQPIIRNGSGIFVRKDGSTQEISRAEWDEICPGHEPTIAEQAAHTNMVFDANITHNLCEMADKAGLYDPMWRPDEVGITKAKQLIEPLQTGLAALKANPTKFQQYNPSNGWGSYEGLVRFTENYLHACQEYPDADVRASR